MDNIRHGPNFTEPDGSRDLIDCGDGDDTAFINISQDKDIPASNCEHVIRPG